MGRWTDGQLDGLAVGLLTDEQIITHIDKCINKHSSIFRLPSMCHIRCQIFPIFCNFLIWESAEPRNTDKNEYLIVKMGFIYF
jgi:hypothetical protein